MKWRRVVLWSILGVVLLGVVLVAVVAAGIGGEASTLNTYLSGAVSSHAPLDQVKQELIKTGVQLESQSVPALTGTGPHHSAILYSTWLTVKVEFTNDMKARAFEIERASEWF